jgi:hypothetical protein
MFSLKQKVINELGKANVSEEAEHQILRCTVDDP